MLNLIGKFEHRFSHGAEVYDLSCFFAHLNHPDVRIVAKTSIQSVQHDAQNTCLYLYTVETKWVMQKKNNYLN